MSNVLSKMKRKNKRIDKKTVKQLKTQSSKMDFKSKVLPNTLYVDVKNSIIYIGDDTNLIGNCKRLEVGTTIESNDQLLEDLKKLDKDSINKVILDNQDNFKILSFDEFITNLTLNIDKLKNHLSSRIFHLDDKFGSLILMLQHSSGNYFCVSVDSTNEEQYVILTKFNEFFEFVDTKEYHEFGNITVVKERQDGMIVFIGVDHDGYKSTIVIVDDKLNVFVKNEIDIEDSFVVARSIEFINEDIFIIGIAERHSKGTGYGLIIKFDKDLYDPEFKLFENTDSNFIGFTASTITDICSEKQLLVSGLSETKIGDTERMVVSFFYFDTDLNIKRSESVITSESVVINDIIQDDSSLIGCGIIFEDEDTPIIFSKSDNSFVMYKIQGDVSGLTQITVSDDDLIFSGKMLPNTQKSDIATIIVTNKALEFKYARMFEESPSMIVNVNKTNKGVLTTISSDTSTFALEAKSFKSLNYNDKKIFGNRTVKYEELSSRFIPFGLTELPIEINIK
jgi:hypothetical protein